MENPRVTAHHTVTTLLLLCIYVHYASRGKSQTLAMAMLASFVLGFLSDGDCIAFAGDMACLSIEDQRRCQDDVVDGEYIHYRELLGSIVAWGLDDITSC